MAKAFDNRVGMAGVIQAGQILASSSHPNRLVLCGTVQEEVGLRGAKTAAHFAKPDVAIVLEGPPADDSPVETARSWLLSVGWMRHGKISIFEQPKR
jgi:endoglucanase